jgi:hypothetical protein
MYKPIQCLFIHSVSCNFILKLNIFPLFCTQVWKNTCVFKTLYNIALQNSSEHMGIRKAAFEAFFRISLKNNIAEGMEVFYSAVSRNVEKVVSNVSGVEILFCNTTRFGHVSRRRRKTSFMFRLGNFSSCRFFSQTLTRRIIICSLESPQHRLTAVIHILKDSGRGSKILKTTKFFPRWYSSAAR